MIVATAGHVDHGKTSLVRALTGVDTDRLEEEKRRGLSIDLGFAYADLGTSEPVGFVDVPGHERFVRNMLAGVAAIDLALLVIAADDGPMPQTIEHIAILRLLGITRAAVVLSKVDRVDAARIAQVRAEIARILAATEFEASEVFEVAAPSGLGIDALRCFLAGTARELNGAENYIPADDSATRTAHADAGFRLSIDRAFSLQGAGLVVTGAVHAGRCSVGDRLIVSPAGIEARVRSIHANNQAAQNAQAGQRCAINLAGLELRKTDIARGDWLLDPSLHAPTQRIDVLIELLATEPRALTDTTSMQLHLAASSVQARLVLLGIKSITPGKTGLAQLVLEHPIAALYGDRFVLRDAAAQRTVGGGRVLDPLAPARGRAKPERLAELDALKLSNPADALRQLLGLRPDGVELRAYLRARNLSASEHTALASALAWVQIDVPTGPLALDNTHWQTACDRWLSQVAAHHAMFSDHLGLREPRVDPISSAALRALIDEGAVVRDGLYLRLPSHRPALSPQHLVLWQRVEPLLSRTGLRPPIVGELVRELDVDLARLTEVLKQASQLGLVEPVAANRYFLPATIGALVQVARELAAESADGSFDAASFRDRSGIGRNLTIQVLEYFDRCGFTRFARERRQMVR